MFEVDDIRDWRGQSVVDRDGSKIGNLEAVYFDTSTDQAVFATVKVGLVGGGKLVFVPLVGAKVAPKHIRVMTEKKLAKDAPFINNDGEIEAAADAIRERLAAAGFSIEDTADGPVWSVSDAAST